MNTQELKVNYKKLLKKATQANGRKETVSYLNRAAKIKSKLYSTIKINCLRCNGAGFLRVSLDETKTFIKWEGVTPSFVSNLTSTEGPYTQSEIRTILHTDAWVSEEV